MKENDIFTSAEDVYKLCGLLQLLSEVDVTLIGNVSISK